MSSPRYVRQRSDMSDRSPNAPPPRVIPALGRHQSALPSYGDRRYSRDSSKTSEESSHGYYSCTERESVETYSSSPSASLEDIDDRKPSYQYEQHRIPLSDAKSSTPPLFAHLFPSTRRLRIKHDESIDGNMNVRIDTNMSHSSEPPRWVTLFHMKMNNLKSREMVLRRYGRDCGREVVNFRRKYEKTGSGHPKPERSGSKLMSTLMGKAEPKDRALARQDSGYESADDDNESFSDSEHHQHKSPVTEKASSLSPTKTTLLEFSNYAHVDLKRRGTKGSKRYEFEYWGKTYAWKRKVTTYGQEEAYSFCCVNTATNNIVAHIRPDNLCPIEVAEEAAKGGFVPQSTMWLCDDNADNVIDGICGDVAE